MKMTRAHDREFKNEAGSHRSTQAVAFASILLLAAFFIWTGTARAEHFFEQNNTWYEQIPSNAAIVADSALYIDRIKRNSTYLSVAARNWTVPVFYAKADTPNVTVAVDYTLPDGWNVVPIPAEALPDLNDTRCAGQYTDGHMVVVSADRHWAWDFYHASKCNGVWHAAWTRKWDLTDDGVKGRGPAVCQRCRFFRV
jgi:hypothetical protein